MAITVKYYESLSGTYQAVSDKIIPVTDARLKVEGLTANAATTVALSYTDPVASPAASVQIFSRRYYSGLSNDLELDLRDELRQLLRLSNIGGTDGAEHYSFLNLALSVGQSSFRFVVTLNDCYTNLATPWTGIDCLDVDSATEIRFGIRNPHTGSAGQSATGGTLTVASSISVQTRRGVRLLGSHSFTGDYYQPMLMWRKTMDDLPVIQGEPFRIIFGSVAGVTPAPSPFYRIRAGKAEQFLFLNNHGVLDVLPLFGDLSSSPDYTFETVTTDTERLSVRAGRDEAYTQHSGYLSSRSFLALGALLTSRQIYHRTGGGWHQIIIEETDYVFSAGEHLHSCSFKFRYCDKNLSITI